jgi:cell division protein FtsQ
MSENKFHIKSVLFFTGIALCLIFGANAWKSSLTIKQIKIDGNRIVTVNEIIQLTQIQTGSLLYKADLTAIQHNVKSHHYIKDVIVERSLPNTIHIKIKERIPIAIVNRSDNFYLDEDGVILPKNISNKIFDLPLISGVSASEPVSLGSIIKQPDVIETLRLLSLMKAVNRPLYHNISEVQVRNGGDIILYSAENGVPIIFGRGDVPQKLVKLEAFWNSVVRERGSQSLQYIDLRYQDQIITRWNHGASAI